MCNMCRIEDGFYNILHLHRTSPVSARVEAVQREILAASGITSEARFRYYDAFSEKYNGIEYHYGKDFTITVSKAMDAHDLQQAFAYLKRRFRVSHIDRLVSHTESFIKVPLQKQNPTLAFLRNRLTRLGFTCFISPKWLEVYTSDDTGMGVSPDGKVSLTSRGKISEMQFAVSVIDFYMK